MGKKLGIGCVVLGILSLVGALSLWGYNQFENQQAIQVSQSHLAVVQQAIASNVDIEQPQQTAVAPAATTQEETVETTQGEGPVATILVDGIAYIGYLTVPSLQLELPISSQYIYEKLSIAPCRQFGTVASGDLVIAGHNYTAHFATLKRLASGDSVLFTDANGQVYHYSVDVVKEIGATDVSAVQDSGYALVLYTCTVGGTNRVAVFCSRQVDEC